MPSCLRAKSLNRNSSVSEQIKREAGRQRLSVDDWANGHSFRAGRKRDETQKIANIQMNNIKTSIHTHTHTHTHTRTCTSALIVITRIAQSVLAIVTDK